MTQHVHDRLTERLTGVVPNPSELLAAALSYAHRAGFRTAVAMRVARLERQCGAVKANDNSYVRGQYADRPSNGDEVWIVARHGRLVTVMFRRSSQPTKAAAFDVNLTVDLTNGAPVVLDRVEVIQWRQRSA